MAGIGSRLRPHTLTVPKPLTVIAGKPIVQRLVEDIAAVIDEKIEEIAFVIGTVAKGFPADTTQQLLKTKITIKTFQIEMTSKTIIFQLIK